MLIVERLHGNLDHVLRIEENNGVGRFDTEKKKKNKKGTGSKIVPENMKKLLLRGKKNFNFKKKLEI